jgi:hypothetical protein
VYRLAYTYASAQIGSKIRLIILGTLCTLVGNWLIGANYSPMAWIWLLIGYLDIATKDYAINTKEPK